MEIVHKKNTAYYLVVPMVDSTTPANFKAGETVVDTAYSKDGSGAWTALAIADTFTEIGSTGVYALNLIASEMNYDQVMIKMTSTNGADSMVLFRMNTENIDDVSDDINSLDSDVSSLSDDVDGIKSATPGPNVINN